MAIVSVRNLTRERIPRIPFTAIANSVLPQHYELSLVFISSKKSRALNLKWKHKNKPANVLSFPLSKHFGEIFISPSVAATQASAFGKSRSQFLAYLFIHGLLHLEGFDHGDTMEQAELRIGRKFNIY
jgi:probable rRNA maturation factor